jgi:hypothetical protein
VHFDNKLLAKVCMLSVPEMPSQKVVSVIKTGDEQIWQRKHGISEQTHQLMLDGQIVGNYKTASVWRLPLFPGLLIGCVPFGGGSGCVADFTRSHMFLDTVPNGIDRERFDGPESVMLGLPKHTAADLANFRGYPQNEAALTWLAGEPLRVEDRMFALLEELAGGGSPKVPMGIKFSVVKNPERLAPLAEAMANRFIQLSNIRPAAGDGQEYNYRYEGLAAALTALPDEAFSKIATPLNAYFADAMTRNQFPELHARIKRVSGQPALDFYEADFMTAEGYRRLFPVLAICRIGRASPEIIAEMKARMLHGIDSPSLDDDSTTALIVTLMKLGEAAFVRDNRSRLAAQARPDFDSWLGAVLSGKGATEVGPNNCMTKDWNGRRATRPSLHWTNGTWRLRS